MAFVDRADRGWSSRATARSAPTPSGSPRTCGVDDRVTFLGAVDDEALLALYAGALAVVYAPFDEDFGYVTLEAFLARQAGLTARDSGGPLEFVQDGVNGAVVDAASPRPSPTPSTRYAARRGRAPRRTATRATLAPARSPGRASSSASSGPR